MRPRALSTVAARLRAPAAAGAVAALLIGSGVASGSSLVVVSKSDPYAACPTPGQAARNYPRAEVEPNVAVNPTNSSNVVGVWQQDRWSDGGSRGLVAGVSFDGGATFEEVPLPFSRCAPGGLPFDRASDPWVSFGPDGTAYAIGLSLSFMASGSASAVAVSTSGDGGRSWQSPTIVQTDVSPEILKDKESITAGPATPGTAYAVWDRSDSLDAVTFTGPAMFSRTTDGGRTWSTPAVIVQTGVNDQTIGNVIVVGKTAGSPLYDFFNLIIANGPHAGYNVAFVKSTDGGASWSAPKIVSPMLSVGFTDPRTNAPVRTADILPEPAIDAATGDLYVVWQDSRFNGGQYDEVALSISADGGTTFSPPARVNLPTGRPALVPAVAVGSSGAVGVTYYQVGPNLGSGLPTRYVLKKSPRGGAQFGPDLPVTGEPFDLLVAPFAVGLFLGDYEGLVPAGDGFRPFFVKGNSGDFGNPTDIVTGVFGGENPAGP